MIQTSSWKIKQVQREVYSTRSTTWVRTLRALSSGRGEVLADHYQRLLYCWLSQQTHRQLCFFSGRASQPHELTELSSAPSRSCSAFFLLLLTWPILARSPFAHHLADASSSSPRSLSTHKRNLTTFARYEIHFVVTCTLFGVCL